MKKVENVDQPEEQRTTWKAQVFWSHRTWESTILEQVPDDKIIWRSKGAKGYVDGAVTFHELAPNLTRVLAGPRVPPAGHVRAHREHLAGAGQAGPPGTEALPAAPDDGGRAEPGRHRGLARHDPRRRGGREPRGRDRPGRAGASRAGQVSRQARDDRTDEAAESGAAESSEAAAAEGEEPEEPDEERDEPPGARRRARAASATRRQPRGQQDREEDEGRGEESGNGRARAASARAGADAPRRGRRPARERPAHSEKRRKRRQRTAAANGRGAARR